jgi:hypothetical protein
VSGSLEDARKHTADVGSAISEVVRGAFQGIGEIGADVRKGAKGTLIGVLRASREAGRGALDAVTTTAGVVVKSTAQFGGDLKMAAEGVVEGAIAGHV